MRDSIFCRSSPTPQPRRGFSLLEVILSLAILGGSIAVLGEVVRLGMDAAQTSRDLTQAQLISESIMAEIAAGYRPMESERDVRFEYAVDDNSVGWLYSIYWDTTVEQELYVVEVTVVQDLAAQNKPTEFTLVRWMPDPVMVASAVTGLELAALQAAVAEETESTTETVTDSGTAEEDVWAGFGLEEEETDEY